MILLLHSKYTTSETLTQNPNNIKKNEIVTEPSRIQPMFDYEVCPSGSRLNMNMYTLLCSGRWTHLFEIYVHGKVRILFLIIYSHASFYICFHFYWMKWMDLAIWVAHIRKQFFFCCCWWLGRRYTVGNCFIINELNWVKMMFGLLTIFMVLWLMYCILKWWRPA